jgi:phytol kinase
MIYDVFVYLCITVGYWIISASMTLLIKKIVNPSLELWRKMLHLIAFNFVFILLYVFPTWQIAVTVILTFMIIVYLILTSIEHLPKYSRSLAQRKDGEIKMSLILFCLMYIILTTLFWGYLGPNWKYIIIVGVMTWGYGDAAAALVGKQFGRHHIMHKYTEGKKTIEGTAAMFAVSCLTVVLTTTIFTQIPLHLCLITGLLVATTSAFVELFSPNGTDTITVPTSAAIATFLIVYSMNLMGVLT